MLKNCDSARRNQPSDQKANFSRDPDFRTGNGKLDRKMVLCEKVIFLITRLISSCTVTDFLNLSGLTRNAKLVRESMRSTTIDQNQFQPHFLEFVGYDILHLHSRKVSPRNEETY